MIDCFFLLSVDVNVRFTRVSVCSRRDKITNLMFEKLANSQEQNKNKKNRNKEHFKPTYIHTKRGSNMIGIDGLFFWVCVHTQTNHVAYVPFLIERIVKHKTIKDVCIAVAR